MLSSTSMLTNTIAHEEFHYQEPATMLPWNDRRGDPVEVGILGLITAQTAETAEEIGKLINPYVLHYPLTKDEELPTFAFPYSPAQSERGPVYEFALNHVMELDHPMQAFRLDVSEVGHA